jgi:hypothetical protein
MMQKLAKDEVFRLPQAYELHSPLDSKAIETYLNQDNRLSYLHWWIYVGMVMQRESNIPQICHCIYYGIPKCQLGH